MPSTSRVILLLLAVIVASAIWPSVRGRLLPPTEPPDGVVRRLEARIPEMRVDLPAAEALPFVATLMGVPIQCDWPALSAYGVSPGDRVTARLYNVKGSKVLGLLASILSPGDDRGIFWEVAGDGSIVLSTPTDHFRRNARLDVYDLTDLIPEPSPCFPTGPPTERDRTDLEEDVLKLVRETVAPASWQDAAPGGPAVAGIRDGRLWVVQTSENHRSLVNLVEQLREQAGLGHERPYLPQQIAEPSWAARRRGR